MSINPSVQYQSALTTPDSDDIIDINESKAVGGKFYCPYCKGEMFPRCGEHNAWHFAHKEKKCDYNHYLHTIAEIKIQKWIRNSQQIFLSLPRMETCSESANCGFYEKGTCASNSRIQYNLKDSYSECKREVRLKYGDKTYIPDLLLCPKETKNNPIFIEINVTHPCEQDKKDLGVRIIEFDIKTENDINRIIGSTIRRCEFTHLYEPIFLHKYTIFSSHKTFLDFHILCRYDPIFSRHYKSYKLRRGMFEITFRNEYDEQIHSEGGMEVIGMAYASQYDKTLKSCCLCKNQTFSDDRYIICKLRKERGCRFLTCKDATQCPEYQRGEDIIDKRIKVLDKYRETHFVDIWINDLVKTHISDNSDK
jgi:hypothetical protein